MIFLKTIMRSWCLLRRLSITCSMLFAALCLVWSASTMAQSQPDSKGTDFWVMFKQNLTATEITLFITGDIATTGTVEAPGVGFSTPFSVTPGTVTTVPLPLSVIHNIVDSVQNVGVNIVAEDEVTVYGLNRRTNTTDAFLALPTDILGTEHINLGYENTNVVNATQFGLVAVQDGTTVEITPSTNAGSRTAGVPYTIGLNRGQTYLLRSTGGAPADLTGTTIVSNNPIAVFGGHQCANIPVGFVACDHLVEQLPPVSTWGTSFVTFPLATRTGGDTFRVLASEDNTTVSINGSVVATLDRGEFHETILTVPSNINADNAVLVAQYSNGTSFDNVVSDPFEVIVPPFEQFLSGYTVTTPETGFNINFINIVVPDASVGAVLLDGSPIPAADYTSIAGTGFSGAAVEVALGSHTINGPSPFGITTYGFASADSYGYPGGLALAEISNLTSLSLTPETATNPVNTEHCVVATTLDQNDAPLLGIRVDFSITGVHPQTSFVFTDAAGEAEYCYTGTVEGTDTIVASVGDVNDTATKEWTDDVVEPVSCDVNDDGFIDRMDIQMINGARNTPVPPGNPSWDIDGNGIINVLDARQCILQCDLARCAIDQPPS